MNKKIFSGAATVRILKCLCTAWLALWYSAVFAQVKLPALISDGMVLQQRSEVTLWGWAAPGEKISISAGWLKSPVHVTAGKNGQWKVQLATAAAGGPYTLDFKASNDIEVKNVLLGEVWLCSGQSNMQFTLGKGPSNWETGVFNADKEIAKANYPEIREFTVKQNVADTLKTDVEGEWQTCVPQNARMFSAVAYYYAREIFKKTGFPVGLINSTWGGTPAESWMRKEVLQADPDLSVILARYQHNLETYPQDIAAYPARFKQWQKDTAAAHLNNQRPPKAPGRPANPATNSKSPCKLYNAMIAPLTPYTIKGVIWYQGESNAGRAYQYRKLFPALIKSWRNDRHNNHLPFYFVQISPHYTQNAEIREAQLLTWQTVPHTGMAVTIDNGDSANVHPRNKELVGKRLALWPLSHDYGYKHLVYSGPVYRSMKTDGDSIRLFFNYTDGGLKAKGSELTEFTVAGADHVFHTAQAKIEGNTIVVSSPLVSKPVAARFAFRGIPSPSLYNGAGLPATPFRTDDWPVITQGIN